MIAFLIKRLFHALLVMFVISIIAFSIQDNLGDPIQQMVGQSVPESEREALREELGLNDPFLVQYLRFAKNAAQLDFGYSYIFNEPTTEVVLRHLPATLELVAATTLLIVLLSVPIGVYSAIKPRALLSRFFMGVSIVGISIPVFLTAIVLIQLFAIGVTWTPFPADTGWGSWLNDLITTDGGMPAYGRGDPVHVFGTWYTNFASTDGLVYLVLPAISLASIMLPLFIRLIRAEMLEVLQSEYVKFARAKRISLRRIYFLHALKNTMLPVITVGGVQIGTMVAYTILTETVFQWPGIGAMLVKAISTRDILLVQGGVLVVAASYVLFNLAADVAQSSLDPRLRR